MAEILGKNAIVTIDGDDISAYVKKVDFDREADALDKTTLGSGSKKYAGGLKDGKVALEGVYDSAAGGPRDTIEPLLGTTVTFVYKPEGTGTGKPSKTVSVVVTGYKESSPADDLIRWSAELQMTGDVTLATL